MGRGNRSWRAMSDAAGDGGSFCDDRGPRWRLGSARAGAVLVRALAARRSASAPNREAVLLEFVAEARQGRGYFDRTWRGARTAHHKYVTLGDRTGTHSWLLFDLNPTPSNCTTSSTIPRQAYSRGECTGC